MKISRPIMHTQVPRDIELPTRVIRQFFTASTRSFSGEWSWSVVGKQNYRRQIRLMRIQLGLEINKNVINFGVCYAWVALQRNLLSQQIMNEFKMIEE